MTVTILKHHEGYNPNDVIDVSDELGRYWVAVGVATDELPDHEAIDKSLDAKLKKAKKKSK